jgi:hypothetical protein
MVTEDTTFGSITDKPRVIKIHKKVKHLNKVEIVHYGLNMNDAYIEIYDPIFETIQEVSN